MLRLLSSLALPALAAACAPAPPIASGSGGGDEGGIGGTGLRTTDRRPEDGGIGGTGIFGTVTGLGSVLVNGLRLETWSGTAVETLARSGPPVLPGDTVAAEAVRDGDRLLATRLTVFHPLVGPLETLADGGRAVAGTRLLLPAGLAPPEAGRMVAVSGLWRGEAVAASAIRALAEPGPVVLRGQLRRRGLGWAVGGTRLDPRSLPPGILPERFVTLRGRPGPAGLVVDALDERPLGVFAGRVGALSVEGFLAHDADGPGYQLSGFGLARDPTSPLAPRVAERQLFLGRAAPGSRIEAALPLPAEPGPRAAALAAPGARAAIAAWLARG